MTRRARAGTAPGSSPAVTLGALVAAAAFRSLHRRAARADRGGVRLVAGRHLRGGQPQPRALRPHRALRRRVHGALRHPPDGGHRAGRRRCGERPHDADDPALAAVAALGRVHRHRHRRDGPGASARSSRTAGSTPSAASSPASSRPPTPTGQLLFLPLIARTAASSGGVPPPASSRCSPCSWPCSSSPFCATGPPTTGCCPTALEPGSIVVDADPLRRLARPGGGRRAARPRAGAGSFWALVLPSGSAAGRPTASSRPTSCPPRTTTGCRPRPRPVCSPSSASSTSPAPSRPAGSPTGSTRAGCSSPTTAAAASRCSPSTPCSRRGIEPGHVGVHRLLRVRLGRDRAADGRVVPHPLRARATRAWSSVGSSRRTWSGRASGPASRGGCATSQGDYHWAWVVAAALCFASVAITLSIPRMRRAAGATDRASAAGREQGQPTRVTTPVARAWRASLASLSGRPASTSCAWRATA